MENRNETHEAVGIANGADEEVTDEMIAAAYWTLSGWVCPDADVAEILTRTYLQMRAFARRS